MPHAMTLGELLAAAPAGITQVAGPPAGDRPVRWAHSTELVHPARYLRGGELVLTVGSALTTAASCDELVAELTGVGASALGLGVGDVHDTVPPALVAACDHAGLPLLAVPPQLPFQTLTELLAEHRVASRLAGPRRASTLVRALLEAVAQTGPQAEPLSLLAGELGGGVEIVERDGSVAHSAGRPGSIPAITVPLPGSTPGSLRWRPAGDPDPELVRALPDLASAVAVWRHETSEAIRREEAELGRLALLVLDGSASPALLARALAAQGVERVIPTAWREADLPVLHRELPAAPRATLGAAVVAFAPDAEKAETLAEKHRVPCGIGDAALLRNDAGLARGLREALDALALSERRDRPVTFRELATLDALLDRVPERHLRPFHDQLLKPLAEHDRTTGSDLVGTLRAFLVGGSSVVPVARTLYVHPNTLRHRLARIEELTGRNPLALPDRVAFAIALRAADRRGAPAGPAAR